MTNDEVPNDEGMTKPESRIPAASKVHGRRPGRWARQGVVGRRPEWAETGQLLAVQVMPVPMAWAHVDRDGLVNDGFLNCHARPSGFGIRASFVIGYFVIRH